MNIFLKFDFKTKTFGLQSCTNIALSCTKIKEKSDGPRSYNITEKWLKIWASGKDCFATLQLHKANRKQNIYHY